MHSLAQELLTYIRRHELLNAGDRVGVGVSGGIDSVGLLRLLLELRFELGIVLSVVHFNHKLRGVEADADEEFVRNLAREHDLEFYVDRADVAAHAREEAISVETAARQLRYEFFRSLIRGAHADTEIPTSGKIGETLRQAQGRPWATRCGDTTSGAEAPASFAPPDGASGSRAFSNEMPIKLDRIVTGHTLDDQAETVLMRMIRGAGMRGLGAIYPRIEIEDDDGEYCGEIVRPLLQTRRCELEAYLKEIDQPWREDSSNADHHFTRNRVRKLLVPLIEKEFNPKIAEGLAELAEIARDEEEYWENEIAGWMGTAVHWTEPEGRNSHSTQLVQIGAAAPSQVRSSRAMNASVDRLWFLGEPVAVQRRLIKAIADEVEIPLDFKHVDAIVRFAGESGPPGKQLALPSGWKLVREVDELVFSSVSVSGPDPEAADPAPAPRRQTSADYEYTLPVPGRTRVNEIGSEFEAQLVERAGEPADELDSLLSIESLSDGSTLHLTLRNWRAGDRFWPAHTKSPKKIKELLTDLHVPPAARASWPVITCGDEIIWVRGFPVSSRHRAKPGRPVLRIRETPASDPLEN